jgi:cell division protein FtsQ
VALHAKPAVAAGLPFPLPRRLWTVDVRALAPSWRSVALPLVLAATAVALYVGARESSAFSIRAVEVRGVPPDQAARVRHALGPLAGSSLLALDANDLRRRVGALPGIRSFEYDRAFPHTLVIDARAERPAAVLRRGSGSWLVSARGRVLAALPRRAATALPRIWVPRSTEVSLGTTLPDDGGARAARMLALLQRVRFPVPALTVRADPRELTFVLRSRLELRLGSSAEAALKLAIARRVIPRLPTGTTYLDVSLPARPVAGTNPQVGG